MKGLQELLRKQEHMTRQDLIDLLSLTDPADLQALYEAAYAVKTDAVGLLSGPYRVFQPVY